MTGRIDVDAERVAFDLTRLYGVLRRAERQQLWLDRVDVIDRQVEVELLRPLTRRPRRRREIVGPLERHAQTVDVEDDPVILCERDLAADDGPIEIGEFPRVWAVEYD